MGHVVQLKCHSEEQEEVPKHSRDETLERESKGGARPKTRGRSETRCCTATSVDTTELSLAKGYSTLTQCPNSLKRESTLLVPTVAGTMPTQSPAQKNSKLKSVMMLQYGAWKNLFMKGCNITSIL